MGTLRALVAVKREIVGTLPTVLLPPPTEAEPTVKLAAGEMPASIGMSGAVALPLPLLPLLLCSLLLLWPCALPPLLMPCTPACALPPLPLRCC